METCVCKWENENRRKTQKSVWMIMDTLPRALFSSAKLGKVVLISKAKSQKSEDQKTHQKKKTEPWHWHSGSKVEACHLYQSFTLGRTSHIY